jgi:hypothetical protein
MSTVERAVVRFPTERVARSAREGATWPEVVIARARQLLGRILNWVGTPGAIRPLQFNDKLAGQHVAVSVGEIFVCVSVNGRDYYFDRLTGRFDGTGASPG